MFNKKYFVTQNKLTDVVSNIHSFAKQQGFDVSSLQQTKKLRDDLEKPLRLIVFGEPKSGKSSLLAALFGPRLMIPETEPGSFGIDVYKLAQVKKTVDCGNGIRELYRPLIDLKFIELVDTTGRPFDPKEAPSKNREFLEEADFILAVFSSQNPWCAWTWDVLSSLDEELLDKSLILIQQVDLLDKRDLTVVTEHMWSLVEQKLSTPVPMFLVSADQGLAARSQKELVPYAWAASGCGPLEKEFSRRVKKSEKRSAKLFQLREAAENVLEEIEASMGDRQRAIARQEVILAEMEEETSAMGSTQIQNLSKRFDLLGDVLKTDGMEALNILKARLGFVSSVISLFKNEPLPADIERALVNSLGEIVSERSYEDAEELIKACEHYWSSKSEQYENEFEMKPQTFDVVRDAFSRQKEEFSNKLEQIARRAVINLRLRSKLDLFVGERQSRIRMNIAAVMLLIAIAGFLGGLGWGTWVLPVAILGVASMLALATIYYVKTSAKEVYEQFSNRLLSSQRDFISSLQDDYQARLRDVFLEFGVLFDEVRHEIASSRHSMGPMQARWNQLYLELKSIEQELGS